MGRTPQDCLPRTRVYHESLNTIYSCLDDVPDYIASEYRNKVEELHEDQKISINVAGKLRDFRLDSIEKKFLAEEQSALQDFEEEKELLFQEMKEELERQIMVLNVKIGEKSLEELEAITSPVSQKRKAKKPVSVKGPYIVYQLKEEEILEDLAKIRESLASMQS